MKQELKPGVLIEEFDTKEQLYNFKDKLCVVGESLPYLYLGKTFEILEELARDIMFNPWDMRNSYPDFYNKGFYLKSAKESILSACNKPYCVIYKIN